MLYHTKIAPTLKISKSIKLLVKMKKVSYFTKKTYRLFGPCNIYTFKKNSIHRSLLYVFLSHTEVHVVIFSITRRRKHKRRWKNVLFTIKALNSLFVQISARVVFCFLSRLKVLENRIKGRGILCCRRSLINIGETKM